MSSFAANSKHTLGQCSGLLSHLAVCVCMCVYVCVCVYISTCVYMCICVCVFVCVCVHACVCVGCGEPITCFLLEYRPFWKFQKRDF